MLQRNEIPNIYKFTVKQPYKVTPKKFMNTHDSPSNSK